VQGQMRDEVLATPQRLASFAHEWDLAQPLPEPGQWHYSVGEHQVLRDIQHTIQHSCLWVHSSIQQDYLRRLNAPRETVRVG
jgi:hypothetical protein